MEVLFIATFETVTARAPQKSYSSELITLGDTSTIPRTFKNWIESVREQLVEKTGSRHILIHSQIIT